MQDEINQAIQWYYRRDGSWYHVFNDQRNGPNSYDCSSAGYYALIQGGLLPADTRIGNTDSMFGDLERNGWTQITADANGNFPTQRGDVAIWESVVQAQAHSVTSCSLSMRRM